MTLPPVTAGPILLNESPANEIFFNESGSEFFCVKNEGESKLL